MSIIRGDPIQESSVLLANGELLLLKNNEKPADLYEKEWTKAFQKGQEKGEQIGFEKAKEEIKVLLDLLQIMAAKLLEQKMRLLDQLKPEIIEFVIAICERIIRKELTQPEALVKLIHSLLLTASPAMEQDLVHIILAPDDLVLLGGELDYIQYDKQLIKGIRFVADPLMRRGDCRIESKTALLNHDISRELLDLQSKLLQR